MKVKRIMARKVIERARKLKKRVVFFSGNSIEELLEKIGEDVCYARIKHT